jgi:outer membrane protein OmpA-like peptidoglycan-associated protein
MKLLAFLLVWIVFPTLARAQQPDTLVVYFESNQASLSQTNSSQFAFYLQNKFPKDSIENIELCGHCDSIGSDRYNDSLSFARAFFMQKYVKILFPNATFAKIEGKGEREPVSSNESAEGRQSNRRVVMIVYRKQPVPPEKEETTSLQEQPRSVSEILNDTTVAVGEHLALPQLQFVGGRHIPLPGVWIVLDQVAAILKERSTLQIEIQGHVCCSPPSVDGLDFDTQTNDLSVQRAKYIYDYLVKKGISKSRMSYKGFGGSRKLYPDESTEAQRQANRRIEFVVLGK